MVRLLSYLFDVLLLILLLRVLGRVLQQFFGTTQIHFWTSTGASRRPSAPETRRGEAVRDPVCGMFVSTELSHRYVEGDKTLHFCSRKCLERYQKDAANAAS